MSFPRNSLLTHFSHTWNTGGYNDHARYSTYTPGIPWDTAIMPGIPFIHLEYQGIQWSCQVFHFSHTWNTRGYNDHARYSTYTHGIPGDTMMMPGIPLIHLEYQRIQWSCQVFYFSHTWNTMEYNGHARYSTYTTGIQEDTMILPGIPLLSHLEYRGIQWSCQVFYYSHTWNTFNFKTIYWLIGYWHKNFTITIVKNKNDYICFNH